jgi:hypothetical protein
VLQLTWEIAEKPTNDKIKLQAFAQLNEGYKYKMDLTTNGVVVTDAIKYVQGQRSLKQVRETTTAGHQTERRYRKAENYQWDFLIV